MSIKPIVGRMMSTCLVFLIVEILRFVMKPLVRLREQSIKLLTKQIVFQAKAFSRAVQKELWPHGQVNIHVVRIEVAPFR